MNCIGNGAGILGAFKANRINVAISFAAAVLLSKAVFCQCALDAIETILYASLGSIETIFHAAINSVEAITNAVGNAAKLTIYILIIKALEQVGASYCILQFCGTITSE